jgi:hypothetical protein
VHSHFIIKLRRKEGLGTNNFWLDLKIAQLEGEMSPTTQEPSSPRAEMAKRVTPPFTLKESVPRSK